MAFIGGRAKDSSPLLVDAPANMINSAQTRCLSSGVSKQNAALRFCVRGKEKTQRTGGTLSPGGAPTGPLSLTRHHYPPVLTPWNHIWGGAHFPKFPLGPFPSRRDLFLRNISYHSKGAITLRVLSPLTLHICAKISVSSPSQILPLYKRLCAFLAQI